MTIIRLQVNDLTELERALPDGVYIGAMAAEYEEGTATETDLGTPTGWYLASHYLLREEDQVVVADAVKRADSTRDRERQANYIPTRVPKQERPVDRMAREAVEADTAEKRLALRNRIERKAAVKAALEQIAADRAAAGDIT